jgi:hypothetical protein
MLPWSVPEAGSLAANCAQSSLAALRMPLEMGGLSRADKNTGPDVP